MAESWKQWEGTAVDQFRLEQFLGGSDHSAVFLSHLPNAPSQKVVLKLVPVTPENLELQRVSWEHSARIAHPHLIQLHGSGEESRRPIPEPSDQVSRLVRIASLGRGQEIQPLARVCGRQR